MDYGLGRNRFKAFGFCMKLQFVTRDQRLYCKICLRWKSMTYEDIAGIMGISLANVTTRLFRIKEQLKSMLNA